MKGVSGTVGKNRRLVNDTKITNILALARAGKYHERPKSIQQKENKLFHCPEIKLLMLFRGWFS